MCEWFHCIAGATDRQKRDKTRLEMEYFVVCADCAVVYNRTQMDLRTIRPSPSDS